ncbi:Hypothetical protein LBF_3217 [Leptospira biflexa serovar Patoc strain 'Patoc 1 (Ames)']|jgi:hypothetical protein|uniref:Uncharacterized protein n=1 Tax=Leptospira biflexa serovar Patoc (strain Patoc 1 / ATCC 23582 / Paris) TaxID=456481 RepID=B0SRA4_LEPBP|nr:hypothetical protein [Leptospira biflexa]ABZ95685.1 Hypothetical protein LBF_3217 [Leptospira biflexa serovar Patoc strain 'Patoc 1 (Ames)']ABZ99396.1 Conserved hypothetical protein [Leptospira biflexa serovar Patoc strain 'Patoc 1 (Paris)']TGM37363.1 hypothetical protein EHQ80_07095 [Leptospira biflexa]TGM40700.1 hypothetical protein EHQ89_01660 [Leptospira biflexa]TGM55904.1 hypothetical protein EHQ91_13520 [Leptospira biflexa]
MQYRPDAKELLSAIQDFMMKELLPKLEGDDILSYKTLVSWNMLGVIAREFDSTEYTNTWLDILASKLSISELEKKYSIDTFRNLSKKERYQILYEWNQDLARAIRETSVHSQMNKTHSNDHSTKLDINPKGNVWTLVKSQLKENLSVSNPRFQT